MPPHHTSSSSCATLGDLCCGLQLPDSVNRNDRQPTSIVMDALMTNPDIKTVLHAERQYGQLDRERLPLENPTARKVRLLPASKKYSGKLASAKTHKALHLNLQRSDCKYVPTSYIAIALQVHKDQVHFVEQSLKEVCRAALNKTRT